MRSDSTMFDSHDAVDAGVSAPPAAVAQFSRSAKLWRGFISLSLLLLMPNGAYALSLAWTLENKVAASQAIVRVQLTAVSPRITNSTDSSIVRGKILEVLKGSHDLKEVEFRLESYFSSEQSREMVGKDYYVFLRESPRLAPPSNLLWVLPDGMKPIVENYTEYRFNPGVPVSETYTRSNYIARILSLVNALEKSRGEEQ